MKRALWRFPVKRALSLLLFAALLLSLSACGTLQENDSPDSAGTVEFTDSAGRTVTVSAEVTRIAPSGSVAQMILMTLCPDLLVGLASDPSAEQQPYFPEEMLQLPTFGQFYGSKANLNMEALIAAQPQIVVDLGDRKDTIREDMDVIQEQTGIPTVFISATLDELPAAYRALGKLLCREAEAEERAVFVEKTLAMAAENREKILDGDRKTVMFGTGETGLACNASGSSQADVIDLVGAVNAIRTDEISNRNGGTAVDMEQVYACDPDVILLEAGGPYDDLADAEWSALSAVKNGTYYEIPNHPYSWMSFPPSVNRVLGVWWLGNLLYPDLYDYDMIQVAQEYYALFWHYDLSTEEAALLLSRSTMK